MAFRMNQKVHITAINSTDGIPQTGVVIGLIKIADKHYLSAWTFNDHLRSLRDFEYVVCYERVGKIFTERYLDYQLEAYKK